MGSIFLSIFWTPPPNPLRIVQKYFKNTEMQSKNTQTVCAIRPKGEAKIF